MTAVDLTTADAAEVEDILAAADVLTEDAAALRFATQYDGRLAYCHTEGKWYEYSGSIWERCDTPVAFAYARLMSREVTRNIAKPDRGKLKFINAIEHLSRNDERIARSAATWNQDPWLLGTPAGTVDLTTGKLRPSNPQDFITKTTAVAPAAMAHCPRWREFMSQACGGDPDLVRFLQQIAGYALTGSAREQSLFFLYGPGGNGKGTFVNTIQAVMDTYATTAAINTFTAAKNEKHSTDLAMLRGARLVTASETAQGQRWDQQKISALTGGDTITARFMRMDNFSFKPQFTLLIMGNYKPALDSVDEAMRRRFNIIPFEHKPETVDLKLDEKLRPEWPGILRWMIEGALDWQAEGLKRARLVVERTELYFYDEDSIQHWLDEECEVEGQQSELVAVLFKSWARFCKRNALWAGNSTQLKSLMEKAGFTVTRSAAGARVDGLRLKPVYMQPWDEDDDE